MKKTLLLLFVSLPMLLLSQATPQNLSFDQARGLSGDYYRQAIENYAQTIDGDWQSGRLRSKGYQMPFELYINGAKPENGYPLYISLHGGGGAPAEVNDQQWENQKTLYGAVEGVYFVPRSPTDSWDMWHQEYMDDFLLQIISYSIARLNVDQSRIYLLGYSAGGDGVYNLATRLSDKFAAAAMMAGHPGDAKIENLRNLPFAIYVGANDTDYNRSGLAVEWLKSFMKLHEEDEWGYEYNVNIYPDKGHWMDGLDAEAIGWLANYSRVSSPYRIVWIQDDVLRTRKYNLEVSNPKQGYHIEQGVNRENNTIYITTDDYTEVTIWLDDYIVDLDKEVIIEFNDKEVFRGVIPREESNIIASINGRFDPEYIYWSKITVQRP